MQPTFILITKLKGQECTDSFKSKEELLSFADCYLPHEIEFACEIVEVDGERKWVSLTQDCINEAVRAQRESAALRHHEQIYARAS